MVRSVLALVVIVTSFACAGPAQAQECWRWDAFWYSVARDWKRNNCWPEPFVRADRHSVRVPFVTMVDNGWRRQNLLADHHFEEEAPMLNEAGQIKARWIVTQAPSHHRTLYVSRSETSEETTARVAAVQEYVAQFVRDGETATVLQTDLQALGWPATRVDMIDRSWQESAPAPRLPEPQASSGGSQ
jgi:hypothetical protein